MAGRILYKIFTKNKIDASLTFHGGDHVIGYPWGAYNRSVKQSSSYIGQYCPDYYAFDFIGHKMKDKAGYLNFRGDELSSNE